MEMEIYKYRNVRTCLRDAYVTIAENLKSVMRKTWWTVTLAAIALALTTYFFLPNKALHDWGAANEVASFAVQSAVYLLSFLSCLLMLSTFWNVINGKRWRDNLARVVVTQLLLVAIGCLSAGIIHGLRKWLLAVPTGPMEQPVETSGAITFAFCVIGVLILLLVICIPLCYTFTRFMTGNHWLPFAGYGRGFRYWGNIFVVMLLSYMLAGVMAAMVSLPVVVLVSAQLYSQLGALAGDPLNMPGYFTPLLLVTLTLFYFVLGYIGLWTRVVLAYLYGSIETRQAERNRHEREND